LTFLLPLKLLTITSQSLASHLGAPFSTGSSPIYHLAASVSNVKKTFLPYIPSSCGVPRIYFPSSTLHHVQYTLSSLISSFSVNHHLYADNTQFFFSFHPPTSTQALPTFTMLFSGSYDSWMIPNLLTLNSSKTGFLLVGLKKQLAKIHNSSLNTTHCARNLGFIFKVHFPFQTRSHVSPNIVIIIFVNSTVSTLTSIPKQPLPLQPLTFTPNSITVKNSFYYID